MLQKKRKYKQKHNSENWEDMKKTRKENQIQERRKEEHTDREYSKYATDPRKTREMLHWASSCQLPPYGKVEKRTKLSQNGQRGN